MHHRDFSDKKEYTGDLKISGSLSCNGGHYQNVYVSGSGKIFGDVECGHFKTSGSSLLNGNLKADLYKVSGSSTINGDVEILEVKVSGSSKIKGNAKIDSFKISGSTKIESNLESELLEISGGLDVQGSVVGNNININGRLKVKDDVECEAFNCNGSFIIGGMLNAEVIEIAINGLAAQVNEIGGKNINVTNRSIMPNNLVNKVMSKFNVSFERLEAKVIEGDNISLENTTADVVRGKNIVIGKGCIIKKVEYIDSFEVKSNGVVEESTELNDTNKVDIDILDIKKYD